MNGPGEFQLNQYFLNAAEGFANSSGVPPSTIVIAQTPPHILDAALERGDILYAAVDHKSLAPYKNAENQVVRALATRQPSTTEVHKLRHISDGLVGASEYPGLACVAQQSVYFAEHAEFIRFRRNQLTFLPNLRDSVIGGLLLGAAMFGVTSGSSGQISHSGFEQSNTILQLFSNEAVGPAVVSTFGSGILFLTLHHPDLPFQGRRAHRRAKQRLAKSAQLKST